MSTKNKYLEYLAKELAEHQRETEDAIRLIVAGNACNDDLCEKIAGILDERWGNTNWTALPKEDKMRLIKQYIINK